MIRPDGVDDLLDAVCDPDRNGLLFVAGTDQSDPMLFTPFVERVEKWAQGTHGLAQAVVLDPAATEAFNAAIGETHVARPWSIRTYLPDVDPAWEPDAHRHRIMGDDVAKILTDSGASPDTLLALGLARSPYIGLGGPIALDTSRGYWDLRAVTGPTHFRLTTDRPLAARVHHGTTLALIENKQAAEAICDVFPDLAVT